MTKILQSYWLWLKLMTIKWTTFDSDWIFSSFTSITGWGTDECYGSHCQWITPWGDNCYHLSALHYSWGLLWQCVSVFEREGERVCVCALELEKPLLLERANTYVKMSVVVSMYTLIWHTFKFLTDCGKLEHVQKKFLCCNRLVRKKSI